MTIAEGGLPNPDSQGDDASPDPTRGEKWPKWGLRFLEELRKTGTMLDAAKAVNRHRTAPYAWWEKSPSFRAACEAIIDQAGAELEASAMHLAIHGEDEPIVSEGAIVATKRKRFPGLMMFLLQNRRGRSKREESDPGSNQAKLAQELADLLGKMRATVPVAETPAPPGSRPSPSGQGAPS